MYINNYFNTTIWSEQKPEFIKSLNKASNKYIKAAKNFPEAKAHIKKLGDFGRSYHSTSLTVDNNILHKAITSIKVPIRYIINLNYYEK